MRLVDPDLDAEVAGTSIHDSLEVNAWYDGEVVAEHLSLKSWTIDWDARRQVQGQASLVVADPEGTLAPWALSDPLAPGGARLQITWISGITGIEVPLGWWRIRKSDPFEAWRSMKNAAGERVWVAAGGGQISLDADELTCIPAELDRLDAEPVIEPTSLAEATRLLEGIMPIDLDVSITDRPVPKSLVYEEGRMDAVEDHLARVGATYRMGPGGELEVVPQAGVGPVWTIEGGDGEVLISLNRSMSDEKLYNAVVSTAQPDGGVDAVQLVGRAYQMDGPMRWGVGTPMGRIILLHQSPATTQAGVNSDASTLLANRQVSGEVELAVTCVTHPGLQLQDRVVLVPPSMTGDHPITGRVTAMRISGAAVISKTMNLKVAVAVTDLEILARKVRPRG